MGRQKIMLINLRGIYYHYCELPPATFDHLNGGAFYGTIL